MAERTQHSGMLMKQGSRVKSWKLRWFELTADDILKYYNHDTKGIVLKGAIDLAECTCVLPPDSLDNASVKWPRHYGPARNLQNCFGIALGSKRTMYVVAPRPEECKEWVTMLRQRSRQISQFNFQAPPPAWSGMTSTQSESSPTWGGEGTDEALAAAAAAPAAKPKRKAQSVRVALSGGTCR